MQSKPVKLLIALVIGMQLALILGTVYSNEKKLKEAKEIIETSTKDPRSLLGRLCNTKLTFLAMLNI